MSPRFDEMTATDLAERLADRTDDVALIPVGATEQHGPHLPVGTDTLLAVAVAEASAGEHGVVLPPICYGASLFHGTRLSGTIAFGGAELASAATRVAAECIRLGLRRVLFVNGHVGNAASLWIACDELRRDDRARVGVAQWWDLDPAIARRVTADAADWHAGAAETSLVLALRPELVRTDRIAEADDPDRTADTVFRYPVDLVSTNGVTGLPSRASKEFGVQLWTDVVAAASALVDRAHRERAPVGRR